jgi:hypothetical protein
MLTVPSPQADAAIALYAALDAHLEAIRSGEPKRIAEATATYQAAERRRLILSDPRARHLW